MFLRWAFLLLASAAFGGESVFLPDGRVRPDDYTVLQTVDAARSADLTAFQPGSHGKFYVEGWCRADQEARWTVDVPAADGYAVNLLFAQGGATAATAEISAGTNRVSLRIPGGRRQWTREAAEGVLALPAGRQEITLRIRPDDGASRFDLRVMAVELVRPAVRERLHARALPLRADTAWLQQAGYGAMVHWTPESRPRNGAMKSYAEAVDAFDVTAFAGQMASMGVGFVVFTTAHGRQVFPAPIAALDQALPGRTTRRDLVADLAAALEKQGIRLMLYYHLGAVSDPEWMQACGFWETDTRRLFDTWQAIVSEVGLRYGDRLAGWWFDDGSISYYYRSAPWEDLLRAARAGSDKRLVGFNPWELPSPTEFQDLYLGEGNAHPGGAEDRLKSDGDGRYPSGPYQGQQGCGTLIFEDDWIYHGRPGRPRWDAPRLAALLDAFAVCRNVPIFNLEVGQEGGLSPESVEIFRQARTLRRESAR